MLQNIMIFGDMRRLMGWGSCLGLAPARYASPACKYAYITPYYMQLYCFLLSHVIVYLQISCERADI